MQKSQWQEGHDVPKQLLTRFGVDTLSCKLWLNNCEWTSWPSSHWLFCMLLPPHCACVMAHICECICVRGVAKVDSLANGLSFSFYKGVCICLECEGTHLHYRLDLLDLCLLCNYLTYVVWYFSSLYIVRLMFSCVSYLFLKHAKYSYEIKNSSLFPCFRRNRISNQLIFPTMTGKGKVWVFGSN